MSGNGDSEDLQRRAPTAVIEPVGPDRFGERWRVGSSVPINVYAGDRPVCQCHDAYDAMTIVTAVNLMFDEARMAVSPAFVAPAVQGFGTFPITKEEP